MQVLEKLLDACRVRSGYSWTELARRLNVDAGHLSRIKNGKRRVITGRNRWHDALAMTPSEAEIFDAYMDKPDADAKIWEWLDAISEAVLADAVMVSRLATFFDDRSDLFSEADALLLHGILSNREPRDRAMHTITLIDSIRR